MPTPPQFEISGRKVGYKYEPLVIAEIGINHGGILDVAIEMVDSAIHAGAEVIKHQTHILEDEMSREAKDVVPGNVEESIYEVMARCALPLDDEKRLKEYVESREVIFISTPFSRAAADHLASLEVPAFDESIRHAISKLSYVHFVANQAAGNRLIQPGQEKRSIYTVGSPDLDVMYSDQLPSIEEAVRITTSRSNATAYRAVLTRL